MTSVIQEMQKGWEARSRQVLRNMVHPYPTRCFILVRRQLNFPFKGRFYGKWRWKFLQEGKKGRKIPVRNWSMEPNNTLANCFKLSLSWEALPEGTPRALRAFPAASTWSVAFLPIIQRPLGTPLVQGVQRGTVGFQEVEQGLVLARSKNQMARFYGNRTEIIW